ncbi:TIGR01777 family oxidoreductase [Reinekea marinisedimentorum]|uniref:TIGR01777 family protein n=1 Tax=Reinekea marinisedimentorum TaxID=230495 RepID=A0A4R3ICC9_9GAMM|nr:TIGR01777 family oxidoreductase [Reinekea marinisedimentorum]TCS43323.1 hypothetical protein BCF53_102350 [Reinekea marinisedimentorum]
MKILITGATGLIGRNFIRRFHQYHYVALSRRPEAARKLLGSSVELIQSLDELTNLDGFDAVINLAGEPIVGKRWSRSQKRLIADSRFTTTLKLVQLFEQSSQPPATFISGSAIGIYGINAAGLHETSPVTADDFAANLCKEWEQIAQQAAELTRVVALRTGIVLSTQGGALQKMLPAFRLGAGGKLGSGEQMMSWIHIEDMCAAINFLLHNETITGAVNMVAPNSVTNAQFTELLAKELHRLAIIPAPAFALKLALGEAASLLLGSQKIEPRVLESAGFEYRYATLSSALENLISEKE